MTKPIYDSKLERTFKAISNHKSGLTQKQLRTMYGIGSPSREVARLRDMGLPILSIQKRSRGGNILTKYTLTAPTFDMVLAAYKTAPELFTIPLGSEPDTLSIL